MRYGRILIQTDCYRGIDWCITKKSGMNETQEGVGILYIDVFVRYNELGWRGI